MKSNFNNPIYLILACLKFIIVLAFYILLLGIVVMIFIYLFKLVTR
jgi:hypothetical protein